MELDNPIESFTRIVDNDIKQFICDRCYKTKRSKTHLKWIDKDGNAKYLCNGCYGYLKSLKTSKVSNANNNIDRKSKDDIQDIGKFSLEVQLDAAKQDGNVIRFIKNPTEQVQLRAVKNQGLAIRYIMKPSLEVQLEAVRQNGNAIQYILNPPEIIQLEAIKTHPSCIKFIKNPSALIQLEVVKRNGILIQHIENPSFEVQYEAVKRNKIAIKYINMPSLSIQQEAIRYDLLAIRFIKQPFEKVQLEVVRQKPEYIKYIESPTEKVMIKAVQKDYSVIEYIKEPTIKVQIEAIQQNKEAYKKIINPSKQAKLEYEKISSTKFINHSQNNIVRKENANFNIITSIDKEELKKRYFSFNGEMINNIDKFYIINNNEHLDEHINFLCEEIDVINIYIASGFVYKSGLKLIEKSFERALKNKGYIHLIIGSLQDYNRVASEVNYKISGMDKNTAAYVNGLLTHNDVEIRTFEKSFFHGKFYLLEGSKKNCIIIGSSNVSGSGFYINKELNLLYILEDKSETYNEFKSWFIRFWGECTEMHEVNPNYFNDIEMQYDACVEINSIKKMDQDNVKNRINEITDEEVKKRLNLWMNKNPSNIYTDLGIRSLEGYVLFEYKEYDLLVLESFDSGNAYYYFFNSDVNSVTNTIKNLSKAEIFNLSAMSKRGYHIKDSNKLEFSINSLFIKKYKLREDN